ncbi:MAG: cytochrome C oxidase subunit IV family protein [Actinomycetota bacterium]
MSTETTTGTAEHHFGEDITATEPSPIPHEHKDLRDRDYVFIAFLLLVLTALEVAASYVPLGSWKVPLLLIMMVIKFVTVASFFMHLRGDARLFSWMFYTGVFLAVGVYIAALTTFHFFAP